MYLCCRSEYCPTLIFLWIHPLTMATMTTTIFSCFDWLTISVLVWTSCLLQHKIMVHLYCLSPLQLFLLAMVDSNSPHFPLPSHSGVPLFFISICWFFHVMSCSQPQSSFAKMVSQSKVVHGKNNSPSEFLLRQRHVATCAAGLIIAQL
jgi:hypothetical protein